LKIVPERLGDVRRGRHSQNSESLNTHFGTFTSRVADSKRHVLFEAAELEICVMSFRVKRSQSQGKLAAAIFGKCGVGIIHTEY